jgi:hypothetical protein
VASDIQLARGGFRTMAHVLPRDGKKTGMARAAERARVGLGTFADTYSKGVVAWCGTCGAYAHVGLHDLTPSCFEGHGPMHRADGFPTERPPRPKARKAERDPAERARQDELIAQARQAIRDL